MVGAAESAAVTVFVEADAVFAGKVAAADADADAATVLFGAAAAAAIANQSFTPLGPAHAPCAVMGGGLDSSQCRTRAQREAARPVSRRTALLPARWDELHRVSFRGLSYSHSACVMEQPLRH